MGLIRFFLACGVVLCHTSLIFGYSPLSGDLAVQCFYIISGFYMAMILKEKYRGPKSTKTFYINRALKIYPIYWVSLLLIIIWSFFVNYLGYPGVIRQYQDNQPLSNATYIYLALANILLISLDLMFFLGLQDGKMYFTKDFNSTKPAFYTFAFNSIAWTVGLELLFYIIAPFIMRKRIKYIILILLSSLMLRLILAQYNLIHAPWNYMFFPSQLMFFMAGGISYYLYTKITSIKPVISLSIFVIYFLLIVLYYQFFTESYLKQIILFVSTTLAIPFIFMYTKHSKIDRYLGDLSYPIYICQTLIIMVTASHKFPKPLGWGFTALIFCILFSILAHHLITRPIERIRQKRIAFMNVERIKI